ncbi:hypothetical protein L2E82_30859 [Cichorium intybus]|uniref:Uncharacterized protein n=1 Tax=Cichorium intybus TaxID=13427 RepID=A0ACB9D1N1_CICIN|nr:hypothetical protein L2E82_30859 [Cichorium intybus]
METTTGTCDCRREVPFVIMTSDDTYAKTLQLFESNSYFGMKSTQLILEIGPYMDELSKTGGAIKEFVNPNFKSKIDLLVAAVKTGKIVNIKKGQFCAPSVMSNSAEKIRLAGNQNVMASNWRPDIWSVLSSAASSLKEASAGPPPVNL